MNGKERWHSNKGRERGGVSGSPSCLYGVESEPIAHSICVQDRCSFEVVARGFGLLPRILPRCSDETGVLVYGLQAYSVHITLSVAIIGIDVSGSAATLPEYGFSREE